MNHKKTKPTQPSVAAAPLALTLSPWKRRLFGWSAALGFPLVLLVVIELMLRLIGYGYPTHFFVPVNAGPPGLFSENQKFGWRFFPRRLARAPDPIRLLRNKPPGTYRIFVFGESAALGDPEPAYSFSRILRELLEERCPGTKFEIINVGMTAISSHVILRIARDCARFNADLWIIYMGNNEVIGPFGAASVFGSKSPPMFLVRASLAAKSTRIGQLLDAFIQRSVSDSHGAQEWEGMKMMLNQQVRADDPVLEGVYRHFAANLSDILSIAEHAGTTSIVCSVSSNLKDCPPFGSMNQPALMDKRKEEWSRLIATGSAFELKNEYGKALGQYEQAADIDNTHALLAFRIARCQMHLEKPTNARGSFTRARDLDTLRFRADTRENDIIRDLASSKPPSSVRFFDSESTITNACKQGIPGEECFWDHVHFNFSGNYRLARGLAEQVLSLLPDEMRSNAQTNQHVLTEEECTQRLAFTAWDQRSVLERMLRREQEPPFSEQLDHQQLLDRWSRQLTEMDQENGPEGLAKAVQIYSQALAHHPDDWVLHHRFALVLEATGDFSGAERQWREVVDMMPHFVDAWFKLGDLAARQNKPDEAIRCFQRVLENRPDSFEAMNGLGLVSLGQGKLEEAGQFFANALKANSKFAQAHVNLGLLSARRGAIAEAEAHYREALRCDPRSSGAHINFANLLAAQKKYEEAIQHYSEALKLQPGDATVHLELANSLEASHHGSESLAEYKQAVSLNPSLAEAHFNWGVALAKRGDLAGATTCFGEAARLNPNDPQAHLDLGVALAQQSRFQEAIGEFKAVLRLDPGNQNAMQYLRMANAKKGTGP